MIHGIYKKTNPKGSWQLISLVASVEAVESNIIEIIEEAKIGGSENIEVGFQVFDSYFHIPEFLKELKQQKLLYN